MVLRMEFSETIRAKLKERDWSVKKFADEIGRSPEHARKLRNGTAFPSRDLIPRIAAKLELDNIEFQSQVDAAKWEKTHGKKPPVSEHPNFGALEELWPELNAEQREYVICMAKCIVASSQSKHRVH